MPFKERPQPGPIKSGKAPAADGPKPPRSKAFASKKSGRPALANIPRQLETASAAFISRRAADRLRAGHVWVYQSDIERLVAPTDASPLLSVFDARGLLLGTALYSPNSQIVLRLISSGRVDERSWIQIFGERLRAAIRLRQPGADKRNDACRLVFSEADFLPGLIADKYGDLVILQVVTDGMNTASARSEFLRIVVEELAPRAVFERADAHVSNLGEHAATPGEALYCREAASSDASTIFHLNGLGFYFDAASGQKTGSFLDQRENYADAARHCRGEALDVCTYHGGFALHLARVCQRVTGVDASHAALEVAEENLALNRDQLVGSEVDWVEANAFDLLRDWSDSGRRFDTIVLDPPAFAKSKRAAEGALRGYKELNLRALKMLRPGGTLVTCSCSHHVGIEDFTAVLAAAAGDARRQVRLLERRGAAADHPVLLTVPETEYLKCLICRVD